MAASGPVRGPPPTRPELEPTAWIAKERVGALGPLFRFLAIAVPVAAATAVALAILAGRAGDPFAGEVAARENNDIYGALVGAAGVAAMRVVSALAAGLAVFCTAYVGRRLLHSDLAGIVAAAIVALDPAFLLKAHLALPYALILLCAMSALAIALLPTRSSHWVLPVPLALGALLDPVLILWCVPVFLVLWLRGHIYSAPKHLSTALLQAIAAPVVVAALGWGIAALADRRPGGCAPIGRWDALTLSALEQLGPGAIAVHGPLVWIAGVGAMAALTLTSLWYVGARFRLTRLPGRVQLRLPGPMPRLYGRALWLGLLFAAAPLALIWLPLIGLALALGAAALARDARAFGLGTAGAVLVFAAIHLARYASFVQGDASDADVAALLDALPWSGLHSC